MAEEVTAAVAMAPAARALEVAVRRPRRGGAHNYRRPGARRPCRQAENAAAAAATIRLNKAAAPAAAAAAEDDAAAAAVSSRLYFPAAAAAGCWREAAWRELLWRTFVQPSSCCRARLDCRTARPHETVSFCMRLRDCKRKRLGLLKKDVPRLQRSSRRAPDTNVKASDRL